MARAAKREPAITFKHPVQIEIRRPRFEAFASLRQLDFDKLERADLAKIELGYVNTECCQSLVKATIRKGMVTEVRVEPCKTDDRTKLSPGMKKLVDTALKRVGKGNPRPPKFPMTISAMMENLGSITVITCVQICFLGWCIACCQQPSGDVICGRLTIDTTSGPYPEEQ